MKSNSYKVVARDYLEIYCYQDEDIIQDKDREVALYAKKNPIEPYMNGTPKEVSKELSKIVCRTIESQHFRVGDIIRIEFKLKRQD